MNRLVNQLDPKTVRQIAKVIQNELTILGLSPKRIMVKPNGVSEIEVVQARVVGYFHDQSPLYQTGFFLLGRIREGARNPNPELLQMQHAEKVLSEKIGAPVKLFKDADGLAAVAIAYNGQRNSFLSLSQRRELTAAQNGVNLNTTVTPQSPPASPPPTESSFKKQYDFFDYAPLENMPRDGILSICFGVDINGRAQTFPLDSHAAFAGLTRSGKSTFLMAIFGQILSVLLKDEKAVQLALIDTGGVTFSHELWQGLPMLWGGKIAASPLEAIKFINNLWAEKERREKLYTNAYLGFPKTLTAYNKAVSAFNKELMTRFGAETANRHRLEYLPPLIISIEEVTNLVAATDKQFLPPLKRLIVEGLKFGMIVINAEQDFRAEAFDPAITRNSNYRVMIRRASHSTKRTLEMEEAPALTDDVQGRAIAYLNGEMKEIQGLLIADDMFNNMINTLRENCGLEKIETNVANVTEEELVNYLNTKEPEKLITFVEEQPTVPSAALVHSEIRGKFNREAELKIIAQIWAEEGPKDARSMAVRTSWGKTKCSELIAEAKQRGMLEQTGQKAS